MLSTDYSDDLNYIESSRQELRAALETRDGPNCRYCDKELTLESRTIDHVISQREGKRRGWEMESIHGMSNLVLACKACNTTKGDRMLDEDGSIPPRPPGRAERKRIKSERPEVCKSCMSGRKLRIGDVCPVCLSGPQPLQYPTFYKKDPRACAHGWGEEPLERCWMCQLGFVERPEDGT